MEQKIYKHDGKFYVGLGRIPLRNGEKYWYKSGARVVTATQPPSAYALLHHEALAEVPCAPPAGYQYRIEDCAVAYRRPLKNEWFLGEKSRRAAVQYSGFPLADINDGARFILDPTTTVPAPAAKPNTAVILRELVAALIERYPAAYGTPEIGNLKHRLYWAFGAAREAAGIVPDGYYRAADGAVRPDRRKNERRSGESR